MKWPWNATQSLETVIIVTDANSAFHAITNVMSIHSFNSTESMHSSYYYKLEEIVCEHHLEHTNEHYYTYSGAPIPFDPLGVWPIYA